MPFEISRAGFRHAHYSVLPQQDQRPRIEKSCAPQGRLAIGCDYHHRGGGGHFGGTRVLDRTRRFFHAKTAPFTQAQVKRAIAAAKKAGLRVIGIRPDGTIILYDGKGPIEGALRSALGFEAETPTHNPWDDVSAFDDWKEQREAQRPGRVVAPHQAPLVGAAWREHAEKWKEWVRGRPLGVREKRALRELSSIKGHPPPSHQWRGSGHDGQIGGSRIHQNSGRK
jgi:hypothetical protein